MLAFIITILCLAVVYIISWAVTCGLVYLIMLCFGIAFSWKIATGIWLILSLMRLFFGKTTTKK